LRIKPKKEKTKNAVVIDRKKNLVLFGIDEELNRPHLRFIISD